MSVGSFITIVCLSTTLGTTLLQHRTTAGSPLSDPRIPSNTSIAKEVLSEVQGTVLVVGDPLDYPQDVSTWSRTLMANTWYLSSASVLNRYQLIGHTEYNKALCLRHLGGTCAELLDSLFKPREETGMLLVDLLGIDNIQILKKSFEGNQRPSASNNYIDRPDPLPIRPVPGGWSQVSDDSEIALWSRSVPINSTGGLVWSSSGTHISEITRTATRVVLHVEQVAPGGGRAALGRLPWPGYQATGASIGSPIDGFLLSLEVPEGAAGQTVTVTFTPPGWLLGVVSWSIGLGGMALWATVELVASRRSANSSRNESNPVDSEPRPEAVLA